MRISPPPLPAVGLALGWRVCGWGDPADRPRRADQSAGKGDGNAHA
ncbi:hypothetical protein [Thermanaerothrix sp.]|nr:hypothetical protein [Thermanaerothrix sp.]